MNDSKRNVYKTVFCMLVCLMCAKASCMNCPGEYMGFGYYGYEGMYDYGSKPVAKVEALTLTPVNTENAQPVAKVVTSTKVLVHPRRKHGLAADGEYYYKGRQCFDVHEFMMLCSMPL